MTRIRLTGIAAIGLVALALFGCQAKPMDMDQAMKPPPRPAELDRLEKLVGVWVGDATMKMHGSPDFMTSHGVETVSWEADGWVLISRFKYSMGDEDKMSGMGIWTWDPKAKKYRMWHFDSLGGSGVGTMTYDEEDDTWYFEGQGHNPYKGEKTVGEGWSKFTDANTQEWHWTEWGPWKLKKIMEGEGVSRRK